MYLDIGPHRLYNGDCMDVLAQLPENSVDMVLTDPPYGMSFQSGHRSAETKHRAIANDDGLDWLSDFCRLASRVARPDTAHYFFCSWHKIDVFKAELEKHFKVKNLLVWEKNNTSMGDLKGDFAPKLEFVFFCHKGRSTIRGKRDPNIFKFARTDNALHPTQKPVDLCEYLLSKFSDEGMTVFDPFMGSGTTGVACANTRRKFIGVELDPKYFGIACQRIGEAVYE